VQNLFRVQRRFSSSRLLAAKALVVSACLAAPHGALASAPAADDACNTPAYGSADSWDSLNGGYGFSPWQVIPPAGDSYSGAFIGDANGNGGGGGPGINCAGGAAWGLYANGGTEALALRPFMDGGLIAGQRFSIDVDNGYIDGPYSSNNVSEIQLLDAAGQMRFGFHFRGGASEYQVFDASSESFERGTGVPFTDGGLRLAFTRGDGETYSLRIVRLANATTTTLTGVLGGTAGTAVDRLLLVHRNAGPGIASDSYFNNLAISCEGQPSAPTVGSDSPRCEGQDLHLTAGGTAGAVYHWTGPAGFVSSEQNPTVRGVTPANAGSYGVNVTVNGCASATASTAVTVVAAPAQPAPTNDGPACTGGALHLFANTTANAYTWTGPGGFTSSERNPTIYGATAANAGTYNLVVSVNDCTSPMGSTTASVVPGGMTWPSDITIEIGSSPAPTNTGAAVAWGACGAGPVITYADQLQNGECPVVGIVTRSWSAEYDGGATLRGTQVITIVHTDGPTLLGVPSNATVECDAVPLPVNVMAEDAGGFEQGVSTMGLILYYDFDSNDGKVAVDDSGHGNDGSISNAVFTSSGYRGSAYYFDGNGDYIRVQNAPELDASRFTLTAWVKALSAGTASAPRGLFGKHQSSYDEQAYWLYMDGSGLSSLMWGAGTPGPIGTAAGPFLGVWKMVTMTFDGTQQQLYVNDQLIGQRTVPSYSGNTLDLLIGAGEYDFDYDFGGGRPSLWWHGYIDEVRAYDRALTSNEVSRLYVGLTGNAVFAEHSDGDCPRVITRTWTAIDSCGNSTTATQLIQVVDTQRPVLAGVPPDLSLQCENGVPVAARVTAADNCTPMTEPDFSEAETIEDHVEVIRRTWTATDACGNSTTAVQVITVHDTTPPVLLGVPADVTVDAGLVPPPAVVTAEDDCGFEHDLPPGAGLVLCYDFDTDHGNVVPDGTGHGHTGFVDGATYTANGHRGGAYYFDGMDDQITVPNTAWLRSSRFTVSAWAHSLDANVTGLPRGVIGKHQAGFNNNSFWIYQDASGLNAQLWSIGEVGQISTPPEPIIDRWTLVTMTYDGTNQRFFVDGELTGEREVHGYAGDGRDMLIGAGEFTFNGGEPSRWWHGYVDDVRFYERALSPDEVEDLHEDTQARHESIPVQFSATTNNTRPAVITRTWTATDLGGNSVSREQRITVIALAPPELSGQGADATIACPALPVFSPPSATGGCDERPVVSFEDAVKPGACAGSYSVTRTWTAVDSCGNTSAPVSQTITVNDTTPPVIVCPSNQIVVAAGIPAVIKPPRSDDDDRDHNHCDKPGNSRKDSAKGRDDDRDSCGNDHHGDRGHECAHAHGCDGAVVFTEPTVTDACSDATVTCDPPSGSELEPGAHTIRCTAVDACGNTSTCSFVVTVLPRLRIEFDHGSLDDDNVADNIETDRDEANEFKVKSKIPHKVRLRDCSGRDVTASLGARVTVKLDVTLRRYTAAGNSELVADLPEKYSGTGRAGGVMELTGGAFHYNLDTTGYPAGTIKNSTFIRSDVTVTYKDAAGVVAGEEDAWLESK